MRISLRTIVPPSPFLLMLVASHAYSTVTWVIIVHTISERIPITFVSVCFIKRKIIVKVYIGLVPISPNTIPRDFIIFCIA